MIRFVLMGIAVVLLALMVMCSPDPIEDAKKKKAARDADLVGRIMENATKGNIPGATPGGRFTTPEGAGAAPYYPYNNGPVDNEFSRANPYNTQKKPAAPKDEKDPYYPPPPTSKTKPQSWNGTLPKGITPFFLPDGRPIGFYGEKVFLLDENGFAGPLPDGHYSMLDGKLMMVVREGQKINRSSW